MPTRSYYFPKEFSHVENILSAGAEDPREDAFRKFRELGIAPLFSGMDLAKVLGVGPGLLISMLRKQDRHYRRFSIKKSDGSLRFLSSPRTYLKVVQWWILDNILNPLNVSDNAFGFVKGRSIVHNAHHHLGSRHFLNVDIKSFFDNVTEERVASIFTNVGYNPATAAILSGLCCLEGRLPQGAPTSPAIGNQVLRPLDDKMNAISAELGVKYSRYADDLTFSSRHFIEAGLLDILKSEIAQAGFSLKDEKTRWSGPGARPEVTGLVVRDFVQPPRSWRKNQRAALHRLSQKALLEEEDRRFLQGIIGYAMLFPDSTQMRNYKGFAQQLLERGTATKPRLQET